MQKRVEQPTLQLGSILVTPGSTHPIPHYYNKDRGLTELSDLVFSRLRQYVLPEQTIPNAASTHSVALPPYEENGRNLAQVWQ